MSLSSGEELCDDVLRGKDRGPPNSLGLIGSMNVWITFPSTPSTICGGLTDQDILPYALPLWVETLAAASRLSLPSLSASLQQSFSPATTTQTGAAEVMGGLKLKIFSLIPAAPIATLTTSLLGTGAGWGAGVISFKVSDKASRALSVPPDSWKHRQKDSDWSEGF